MVLERTRCRVINSKNTTDCEQGVYDERATSRTRDQYVRFNLGTETQHSNCGYASCISCQLITLAASPPPPLCPARHGHTTMGQSLIEDGHCLHINRSQCASLLPHKIIIVMPLQYTHVHSLVPRSLLSPSFYMMPSGGSPHMTSRLNGRWMGGA